MHLPDFDRVIYEHSPLIQVGCQLRFPSILKIAQEPVDFQDEIRHQYPVFETVPLLFPSELSQIIKQIPTNFKNDISYEFKSEDGNWELSISQNFIALTSSEYERYEDFQDRFQSAISIFERIYKPSFYNRVELYYQNLILRSNLGLEHKSWAELIADRVASELHNTDTAESIESMRKDIILQTDSGKMHFHHGLVIVKEDRLDSKEETGYLLRTNFYTEQKVEEDEQLWTILRKFNRSASSFFRWSITDVLHQAMGPRNPEN
jgi:uncharacterized protein (TIGR04255 family)